MEKQTVIDGTTDSIADAKWTAPVLMQGNTGIKSFTQLFDNSKLEDVEAGVRELNSMSDKCWLLSALVIYAVIYDENMYSCCNNAESEHFCCVSVPFRIGEQLTDLFYNLQDYFFPCIFSLLIPGNKHKSLYK